MKEKYKITKDFLWQEYIKKEKTGLLIAKKLGCSSGTIYNRLRKFNILIRNRSEVMKGNKNTYIDGRSSKIYYCTDCLKRGIKTKIYWKTARQGDGRCQSCANKNRKGKEHYNIGKDHPMFGKRGKDTSGYIHGKAYLPYPMEFNAKLKLKIHKRDNYTCQKCGKTQKQELKFKNRKLDVHHIDYNKQNCKDNNLISLCQTCNVKVNKDRDYWFAYFIYIMGEKRK